MNYRIFFMAALFLIFASARGLSQEIAPQDLERFQIMEDSLLVTADSMYEAFIPEARIVYSERFARQLLHALKIRNSWLYPFEKVREKVNIISADDSSFRIFNWEITPSNITKRYYGAIQLPGEQLKLIGLNDYAGEIEKGAEDSVLTNGKWFGAIYYRILSSDVQGRRVYTLFGYNAASPLTNRKLLDPLVIEDGRAVFGAPIFGVASRNFPHRRVNRFILEYKKGVEVSMNWNDEKKVIIFDRLVSQVNDPHRKYTYVPSGQYDGFTWGNDTWNYLQDLIPITILKDGEAPGDQPR